MTKTATGYVKLTQKSNTKDINQHMLFLVAMSHAIDPLFRTNSIDVGDHQEPGQPRRGRVLPSISP